MKRRIRIAVGAFAVFACVESTLLGDHVVPLTIVTQPQSVTLLEGGLARLTVGATSQARTKYQWYFEGVPVAGGNAEVLALPNISPSQAGMYFVEVSAQGESVISEPAHVVVLSPPRILSQPKSQTLLPGQTVSLEVSVSGTPEPALRWALNGDYIPGATSPVLEIQNAQPADGGRYTVTVFSDLGIVESQPAFVIVDVPVLPFADAFAERGTIRGLSGVGRGSNVGATRSDGEPWIAAKKGKATVWLTWQAPADGVMTVSTVGSHFDTVLGVYAASTINPFAPVASDDDSGGYHASEVTFNAKKDVQYNIGVAGVEKASGNIILSWNLTPTWHELPVVISEPISQTVMQGQRVILSVGFQTADDVQTQWEFNGELLTTATSRELVIEAFDLSNVGSYVARLIQDGMIVHTSPTAELQINTEGLNVGARNKLPDAVDAGFRPGTIQLASPAAAPRKSVALNIRRRSLAVETFVGFSGTQIYWTYPGKDPEEPNHCNVVGGASYWFAWQAPTSGLMRLTTDGSTYDTLLAVYTDDGLGNGFGSLQPVACDNNSGADRVDSAVVFSATAGRQYYVVVDGVLGQTGIVYLNYFLNIPPSLSDIPSVATYEDKAVGPVYFTVSDRETAPSALSVSATSSNPWLVPSTSVSFTGTDTGRYLTVRPALNRSGSAIVTVTVKDSHGATKSDAFAVSVVAVNDPPVAQTDRGVRYPNRSLKIRISALLRNDYDVDGDVLSVISYSSRSYMGAMISQSGEYLVYTPPWGMNSSDYFGYTISDGKGAHATGVVSVCVDSYYGALSVE